MTALIGIIMGSTSDWDTMKHAADTLWAGYQIEKNLGNKAAANNYAVRLKSRHPDSDQTRQLLNEINSR